MTKRKEFIKFFKHRYPYSDKLISFEDRFRVIPKKEYASAGGYVPDVCTFGKYHPKDGVMAWRPQIAVHRHPELEGRLGPYPTIVYREDGAIDEHETICSSRISRKRMDTLDMVVRNINNFRAPIDVFRSGYCPTHGTMPYTLRLCVPPTALTKIFGSPTFGPHNARHTGRFVFFDPLCLGLYVHVWDSYDETKAYLSKEQFDTIHEGYVGVDRVWRYITSKYPLQVSVAIDYRHYNVLDPGILEYWLHGYLIKFVRWLSNKLKLNKNSLARQTELCCFEGELREASSWMFGGYYPSTGLPVTIEL